MLKRPQSGDTLIEVLLAVAIFSVIVLSTMGIMSQGISQAQASLETTLVRNQIDTQAELLRHLNAAKLTSIGRNANDFSVQWDAAIAQVKPQASNYDEISAFEDCTPDRLSGAFYIHPETGRVITTNFEPVETFAQVYVDRALDATTGEPLSRSQMLWVEAVRVMDNDDVLDLTNEYDFHIRACWDSPASKGLMKIGTIVRLYVPKEN